MLQAIGRVKTTVQMRQLAEPAGKLVAGPAHHLVRADSSSGSRKILISPQSSQETPQIIHPSAAPAIPSKDFSPFGYTPLRSSVPSLARAISSASDGDRPSLQRESSSRR